MQLDTSKTPDDFTSNYTSVLAHKVHSIEGGDFPQSVMMIHGALASRRYLIPTAILLSRSIKVYIPEMPGHGASSKPAHALSVIEQADVLFQWMVKNELKQTNIFANSYGCQVAAQLVAKYPHVASTLILTDPTVDPKARTLIQELFRLYIDGFSEPHDARKQFFADLSDMGLVLACETGKRMLEDDIRTKLSKISCPTLVIRGEKDPIAPQKWTQEVAQHIPHAQLRVIANAPHCVNYANPEELSKIVLDFINEPKTN